VLHFRVTLDRLQSDLEEDDVILDQQMEVEPSPLDSSSSSLPPSTAVSSSHTPTVSSTHTPTGSTHGHAPSLLARQQSEIVGLSASASCVGGSEKLGGLLVRSQSMQATSSASPKDTPTVNAESAGVKEEESKDVVRQPTPRKK
jgi:hypothetical protein